MTKKSESNGASQRGGKLQLDSSLIDDAKQAIANYPKTPSEQIEQWAYVGMIVERQLTGQELLQLMTGEAVVSFKTNTNKEGEKRR